MTSIKLFLFVAFIFFNLKNGVFAQKTYEYPFQNPTLTTTERIDDLLSRMTIEEKASQMLHDSREIERLRIPAYNWWNECLHGIARSGRATVFPQAIGMAATFDEELIFRVASAISDEARAIHHEAVRNGWREQYKGLTFWTPNVNIFRDPRWGRGHETYGEDPYLSGLLGSAFVRGLQGDHPKYLKAAACAKHYAVHSGPEKDRHHFNAVASGKDLHETYLPQFKSLVEADVEAVMCAYNRTNDEPCCGSKTLLEDILRQKWGFDGHVVSDCGAIGDIHKNHKYTESPEESAALAIKSGVNLNCGGTYQHIPTAIEKGLLTEKDLDKALRPLLQTRFNLGLLDPPEDNPYTKISTEVIHNADHQDLALEAAQKSVVLLKNDDNVLPLKKDLRFVFVTGPFAANIDVLLANYYGISDEMVTILEGIASKTSPASSVRYKYGQLFDRENINPIDWSTGNAKHADATIAVLGISPLLEGEEGEAIASVSKGDRKKIGLPESQLHYLRKLRDNAGNKPIITVLTGGSPIAAPEVHELSDAVLFAWYPGEKGGQAVADIIFGDAVPSGRLPVTFPKSLDQLPAYDNYDMTGRTYRYMKKTPLYPFGFGLSYTTFRYSDLKLSHDKVRKNETVTVTVKISNNGEVEAEEVAQLYLTDIEASFRMPLYSLRAVKKVLLNPGESKEISFKITPEMMAGINDEGESVIEKGEMKVTVGGSSPGQRSLELGASQHISGSFNIRYNKKL